MSSLLRKMRVELRGLKGACLILPFFCASAHAWALNLPTDNPLKLAQLGYKPVPQPNTAMGRYKRLIADEIGKRWYGRVQQRGDSLTPGACKISFFIDKKGQIEKLRVCSNTSNVTFADFCIACISEARIPTPQSGLFQALKDEKLEIIYNFELRP